MPLGDLLITITYSREWRVYVCVRGALDKNATTACDIRVGRRDRIKAMGINMFVSWDYLVEIYN